ncbi:hypothetical protein EW146_g6817 [Bondarzewia mesenterica]|uniref:Uncharacterized protein n=1 Tax=Bondarzewia mesenterica TaxID=1095465 RepID=A0A4S4LMM9_9AGAM|nr:hypothetical protein EW146_g6817 [Bondarzewia mesenterica]
MSTHLEADYPPCYKFDGDSCLKAPLQRGTPTIPPSSPSTTRLTARNASESAVLHGHKAKTPIVSAIITSSCLVLGWSILFILWVIKRYRKRQRVRTGLAPQEHEKGDIPKYLIPPDPAVLSGLKPGELERPTNGRRTVSDSVVVVEEAYRLTPIRSMS